MNSKPPVNMPFRHPELIKLTEEYGIIKKVPSGEMILHEGQAVRYIPFVLEGNVRVFTKHDEKELLLYHIVPTESCIMSLAVSLRNEPSKINAIAEEDSVLMLIPVQRALEWINVFPEISSHFFQEFYSRYSDLVNTIHQLVFTNLDERLFEYLKEYASKHPGQFIKLKHREIASDLGTAREVVTRILKKLEKSALIRQSKEGIEIIAGL